jgi:ATP-dependent Lhr-like helicase
VALYFREDAPLLGAPKRPDPPATEDHDAIRRRLAAGACFFTDLLADVPLDPAMLQEALWDLVWAGEVTNDAWAPLRAPRLTLARSRRERPRTGARRFSSRRTGASAQVQGRWSLTAPLFEPAAEPGQRRRAQAELLLERYGIVTREQVLAEGIAGGFSTLYDSLSALETVGVARRGYFVEGLGGAQFALPGAVERLRASGGVELDETPPLVLAATDPAQPYGAALQWPKRDGDRRPQRVAGAYVVLVGAEPVVYVERGGKGLLTLVDPGDARLDGALHALAEAVLGGRVGKLGVERFDGEPVVGSRWEERLLDLGFRLGPRRLTLSA